MVVCQEVSTSVAKTPSKSLFSCYIGNKNLFQFAIAEKGHREPLKVLVARESVIPEEPL